MILNTQKDLGYSSSDPKHLRCLVFFSNITKIGQGLFSNVKELHLTIVNSSLGDVLSKAISESEFNTSIIILNLENIQVSSFKNVSEDKFSIF